MTKPSTTIKDVAKEAGFSKSTVSLALRGDARVTPKTQKLVQEAANRLNYVRDPSLGRLAQVRWEGKRNTKEKLAYVENYPDNKSRYDWLLPSLRQTTSSMGYELDTFECSNYTNDRLSDILHHRGIRGVILAPILSGVPIPNLKWERFSIIASEEGHADLPFHSIRPHYRDGLKLCWEALWNRGFRRPGFALLHSEMSPKVSTLAGEFLFLQEKLLKKAQRVPLLLGDLTNPRKVASNLADWFKRFQPDSIIGINDSVRECLASAKWAGISKNAYITAIPQAVTSHSEKRTKLTFDSNLYSKLMIQTLDSLLRSREYGIPDNPVRHLVPVNLRLDNKQ